MILLYIAKCQSSRKWYSYHTVYCIGQLASLLCRNSTNAVDSTICKPNHYHSLHLGLVMSGLMTETKLTSVWYHFEFIFSSGITFLVLSDLVQSDKMFALPKIQIPRQCWGSTSLYWIGLKKTWHSSCQGSYNHIWGTIESGLTLGQRPWCTCP